MACAEVAVVAQEEFNQASIRRYTSLLDTCGALDSWRVGLIDEWH